MTVVHDFTGHAQYRYQSKLLIVKGETFQLLQKNKEHLGFKHTEPEKSHAT